MEDKKGEGEGEGSEWAARLDGAAMPSNIGARLGIARRIADGGWSVAPARTEKVGIR